MDSRGGQAGEAVHLTSVSPWLLSLLFKTYNGVLRSALEVQPVLPWWSPGLGKGTGLG